MYRYLASLVMYVLLLLCALCVLMSVRTGAMQEYTSDVCKEEIAKAIADPQDVTLLYQYPTEPRISLKTWEAVQRMPQVQLEWVMLPTGPDNKLLLFYVRVLTINFT